MYQSNPDGDWHVVFASTEDTESADDLYVIDDIYEYNIGSYSRATGLYLREEDGTYSYVGTVDEIVYGHSADSDSSDKDDSEKESEAGDNTGKTDETDNSGETDETDNTGETDG